MTPLRIRARLRNGYTAKNPWSPAIDGIVASIVVRDRIGSDAFVTGGASTSNLAPVEGLPFAIERDGPLWWYVASCPIALGVAGQERRHFHRRFDDQHERHLRDDVRKVMTAAGPYKGTRLADTRIVCLGVEWHAIGDADEMRRLLARVTQIGGRRSVGYGEVTEWTIDESGDGDTARRRRPLPVAYAERLGLTGPIMPCGLVPPIRINPIECVMPEIAYA